jgi:hypothetical protein
MMRNEETIPMSRIVTDIFPRWAVAVVQISPCDLSGQSIAGGSGEKLQGVCPSHTQVMQIHEHSAADITEKQGL